MYVRICAVAASLILVSGALVINEKQKAVKRSIENIENLRENLSSILDEMEIDFTTTRNTK